jgi:hypothetical protein
MDALATERRQAQETSIASIVKRNTLLVGLALAGLAFATWKLMQR